MLINTTINAGSLLEYTELGDFFRILNASSPMTITFYRQGKEIARSEGVAGGYAERFQIEPFDKLTIQSAATQTIQFVSRYGAQVFYDLPPFGNINGAFAQSQKTVTNASTELLAANLYRRYLLIQNKDSVGSVYLKFGNTAATTANGVRIPAGGSYEITNFAPNDAIQAIGDAASNANIITIEG
jgi:hypothetical protein